MIRFETALTQGKKRGESEDWWLMIDVRRASNLQDRLRRVGQEFCNRAPHDTEYNRINQLKRSQRAFRFSNLSNGQ